MLISAPEGNYNVSINGNGTKFSSEIVVNRNEETVIDTSVAEVEKIKEGNVTFIVTPSFARVFVDGEEIVTEVPHSYTYGKHKLHVMAEGYEPQDHILKVAERDATLFIDLVEKENKDASSDDSSSSSEDSLFTDSSDDTPDYWSSSSSTAGTSDYDPFVTDGNASKTATNRASYTPFQKSGNSSTSSDSSSSKSAGLDSDAAATKATSGSSSSSSSGSSGGKDSDGSSTSKTSDSDDKKEDNNVISGYKVTFDAPIGAEAYLDGNYVGMLPVSFAKTAGKHTVTLSKEGYETKSYTIQIDSEYTNVTYTFPALVPVQKPDGDNSENGNTGDNSGEGNSDSKPEEVSGGQP